MSLTSGDNLLVHFWAGGWETLDLTGADHHSLEVGLQRGRGPALARRTCVDPE